MFENDVGSSAVRHDWTMLAKLAHSCSQVAGMLTLSVHWEIQTFDPAIRAEYLFEMRLRDIFGQLLHHDLRALPWQSLSAEAPTVAFPIPSPLGSSAGTSAASQRSG